jgi:hypothetical protein
VAVHAGRVGWHQVRAAEIRDEALCVKLAVVGHGRVDGGGTLWKFCGGRESASPGASATMSRKIATAFSVRAEAVTATAAGLRYSPSSPSRHVGALLCRGCGLTPILQLTIRKLGRRVRNQRLCEYGARRADVLGVPADAAHSDDDADCCSADGAAGSTGSTPFNHSASQLSRPAC